MSFHKAILHSKEHRTEYRTKKREPIVEEQ